MAFKFTPPPWAWYSDSFHPDDLDLSYGFCVGEGPALCTEGGKIEVMGAGDNCLTFGPTEEREGNASLIRSAPELYLALEEVLASATPNPAEHPAMAAAWAKAEGILKRVRGGK